MVMIVVSVVFVLFKLFTLGVGRGHKHEEKKRYTPCPQLRRWTYSWFSVPGRVLRAITQGIEAEQNHALHLRHKRNKIPEDLRLGS